MRRCLEIEIYLTKAFRRQLKKSPLSEQNLIASCNEMTEGLIDVDYGGCLYKKRVAIPGKGKSGSYRTLLGARLSETYIFLYMFPKSTRDNITSNEEIALKALAKQYLRYSREDLRDLVATGELFQIQISE